MPKAAIHPKWERKTTGVRKAGLILKSGGSTLLHNPGLILKGAKVVGKSVALAGEVAAGTITGGSSALAAGITGASLALDAADIANKFRGDYQANYAEKIRGGNFSRPKKGNRLGI